MTEAPRMPPTVQATWSTDGTLYRITCPHCYRVHVHGPQPGHKAEHCEPGTAGKVLGYFIEPPTETQISTTNTTDSLA